MRILITLSLITLTAVATQARDCNVTYAKSDSLKVVNLLNAARKQPASTNLVLHFARKFKGLPYVAHTLEANKREQLIVNLCQLDCTTLVETVVALCLCMKQHRYTFDAYCDNLRRIRYRQGTTPAYETRLHYFTDWVQDNTTMGICTEIQSPTPPFTARQTISLNFMSTHPDKYAALKASPTLVRAIAATERQLTGITVLYIPEDSLNNANDKLLRNTIHDGDIIATTTTIRGLDVQHLGFAVWKPNGLHMLNTSSLRHKVVEDTTLLHDYLKRQKTMTGIRIIRLNL